MIILQSDSKTHWPVIRALVPVLALFMALSLGGCQQIAYYGQAVGGHMRILAARQPIDRVLADPSLPATTRSSLELVLAVREFAASLGLPVDEAYSRYVATGRPYVVWNVFAAPEFSVTPLAHCFPVAGCVSYKGFFREDAARGEAERLADSGYDVFVGGVAAYSTLGWFDDPVLDTFLNRSDVGLASLIFHELAHRVIYVEGDTTFNESFATVVETAAVRRWLEDRGEVARFEAFLAARARRSEVVSLIASTRRHLADLYATGLPPDAMRRAKQDEIAALQAAYARLRAAWPPGSSEYAGMMRGDINNARLATVAAYHDAVPALTALLESGDGDFGTFFDACEALAALPAAERSERLGLTDLP